MTTTTVRVVSRSLGATTAVWTVTTLTLSHIAVDGVLGGVTALGPSLETRLGVGEGGLAILIAALWAVGSLTQPVFGLLADRVGARRVGAVGAAATGVLVSAVAVTRTPWVALLLVVAGGLGSGAFHPAAAALAHSVPLRRPGTAISVFGAGGAVGLALGPVVVLMIVAAAGVPAVAWSAVAGLTAAVLLYAAPHPPAARHPAPFAPRHLPLLLTGPVGVLAVVATLASLPPITFAAAMPLWLVDGGHAVDASVIGWTLAVYNVAAAAGGVAAVTLGGRIPRLPLLAGSIVASVPALFVVLALPVGGPLFYAAVLVAGALGNAALPLVMITAQDVAPYAVATASGVIGAAVGAAALGYIAVGAAQEALGIAPAMRLAYLAALLAATLAMALARRHPAVSRPPVSSVSLVCPCAPCLCGTCPRSLVGHP